MHVKLQKLITRMLKIAIYALIMCDTSNLALAHRADQAKYLNEITLDIQYEGSSLLELLEEIENTSEFTFAYSKKTMKGRSVHLKSGTWNFNDLLKEVSRQSRISFKRINGSITIKDATSKDQLPLVTEVVDIQSQLTGKVTDLNGDALPGVNITIKGSGMGTVSDIDGNYTLDVPDGNDIIVFSYVGFANQEVSIGGRTVIDVIMIDESAELTEVVVTALGIKKEAKSLGYATASVDSDEVTTNRTTNFMNSLQGKVPGVNITTLGTGPAGTSKVRIRGQSSFGGQNTPLIVVNGVPINNTSYGTLRGNLGSDGSGDTGATADGGDGLTSINPDDIESMTVLKGAAASALYGSRAKDGVIMITTKTKGTAGVQVEYNANFTSDTPLDFTDYQYEYGQGEFGVRPTTANPVSGVWSFGERFQPGMTQVLFDGIEAPYEPVRDRIKKFYRVGHTFTNTISVATGGENGGMRVSLAKLKNQGIVPNNEFDKYSLNLGFTQQLANKLTVSGNINYSHEKITNAPGIVEQDLSTPTVIYSLSNSMPFGLLESQSEDEFGNERIYSRFRNRTNPYFTINNAFNNIKRDRTFGNVAARYNFTSWLYAQVRVGQDYYSRFQEHNTRPTGAAALGAAPAGFVNGRYRQDNTTFRETNADFIIGANQSFGDFGVDVTFGGNQMHRRSDLHSAAVEDFVVRGLYTLDNSRVTINNTAALGTPRYSYQETQINSLFGAAEVNYKEYFYLNLTSRTDWFSTLSKENRSQPYYSVTGSFVFSQAFENLPDWVNFGKIRAAYGEVGSDGDVSPFADNLFYASNANLFNGQTVGRIPGLTVPNKNLKPMRVKEYEFGLETKFVDNRIGFEISYYNKLSIDQILRAQISNTSGYDDQLINVGEARNQGVEMLVNLIPIRNEDFQWEISFNGSYNTSEVLKLGNNPGDTVITVSQGEARGAQLRHVVGKPLGQLYGFGYLRDDNGNQVFDGNSGRPLATPDRISFGNAIPKWVGGFYNTLTYKGIRLSFLIDVKLGHNLISTTNFNAWRHGLHKGTLVGREENVVVGNGVNPNGSVNTIETPLQTYYETVRGSNLMEEFVYNAGYWKLRQLSVGYDFTKYLTSVKFIRSLKLDFVMNNILILKKWAPNIDPEQIGFASDNLNGIEDPALPSTRSIGFNLNVKF